MITRQKKFAYGFLGIGRMAQVILRSLLKSGNAKPTEVLVSRRDTKTLKKISRDLKVHVTDQNDQIIENCRWIWLGIKPFQAQAVLSSLAPKLDSQTLVLSMMAGISTTSLRQLLGPKARIVRLMPNTPALIGEGMTGVYFPSNISRSEQKKIIKILKTTGDVIVMKSESDLDALTGLSGSGPAFVYYFLSGLEKGGIRSGLIPATARRLAIQTLKGAALLLETTGRDPQDLLSEVVSKGGTTEAGLKILEKYHVQKQVTETVARAASRSKEIRIEFDSAISKSSRLNRGRFRSNQ